MVGSGLPFRNSPPPNPSSIEEGSPASYGGPAAVEKSVTGPTELRSLTR